MCHCGCEVEQCMFALFFLHTFVRMWWASSYFISSSDPVHLCLSGWMGWGELTRKSSQSWDGLSWNRLRSLCKRGAWQCESGICWSQNLSQISCMRLHTIQCKDSGVHVVMEIGGSFLYINTLSTSSANILLLEALVSSSVHLSLCSSLWWISGALLYELPFL